ncbi:hypothetical protein D9615_009857 [Tricholomella constricta]|uniref:BTB domain-containing protein n=1 Tax=Tricholomella constricta TaxID=117010 RepID=A0A8H5LX84_9AGAR|nr:hypothetical protein D9615_009857 [Tricholomella constricta]
MSDNLDSPSQTSTDDPCPKLKPIPMWFQDGTLLIKAQDAKFKVYGGLLSSKSSVFRDMFTLNAGVQEAVLELEDSKVDLSYFSKALHDIDFFLPRKLGHVTPIAIVAGILRLSDKYDVPSLRKRAIEHLSVIYPTTLRAWDRASQLESPHISDHLDAIKSARDFNIPWIRPMAVYHFVSQPLETVFPLLHNSNLSEQDQKQCIRAIRALKVLQMFCGAPMRSAGNRKQCHSWSNCGNVQKNKWNAICNDDGADPLKIRLTYTDGFCSSCQGNIDVHYTREKAWNMVPVLFNDESWSQLETLRNAEIGMDIADNTVGVE